ncbi:MAG: L-serine ammonia-lyase [Rhodospirillales bacterium]|nr:L-serine ammonia-lyase [Rhodospirillales bacterium]
MPYSVFELFKVGIGPSSSHTVGPMVAARRFVEELVDQDALVTVGRVESRLYGSLAFTGVGHGSDHAIMLGLSGENPHDIDPNAVPVIIERIDRSQSINLGGRHSVPFDRETDLIFDYGPPLADHANGMIFAAYDRSGEVVSRKTFYSVGGGFIATDTELQNKQDSRETMPGAPFDFDSSRALLTMGDTSGLSIAQMMLANEVSQKPEAEVMAGIDHIWQVMHACMERGLLAKGNLPGGLNVRRRARHIHQELIKDRGLNSSLPHECMDWISLFAIAVNEENASGGRIVTAPTNGAAGVIPAVIRYYLEFCPGADMTGVRTFMLTAAAVGSLIKANASISGAEAGCQGEVGSASAMAAAGLCAALNGSNGQIENAAEIALEHHLGMTCDPVGGLVQVPCIERNAMGAVKAINAASLALRGDGQHFVSLDAVIETMRQTGEDMQSKYKETSQGGLAVNVVAC